MTDFEQQFHQVLSAVGESQINSSAYDTAWLSRLHEVDPALAGGALQWLCEHQLPDGSWGASEFVYGHDRFISTLAAAVALARRGDVDRRVLNRAQSALNRYVKMLRSDPAGATVGFEMIVPTLVADALKMDIISPKVAEDPLIRGMTRARNAKLQALAGRKINRFVTPAFSCEMVGSETNLLDANNLQDQNGSIGCSPAATTFFALHVRQSDANALDYLRRVAVNGDGGAPYVVPIDTFESAWVLWNLHLVGLDNLSQETLSLCTRHLDFLEGQWTDQGVASVAGLGFKDGDATSVTFDALRQYGRAVDMAGIMHYEMDNRFRCYPLEADASTSTNIHILGALRAAGLDRHHPAVVKVLGFLRRARTAKLFWFDKWHSSPYYPTSHAMMALTGYDNSLVADALYWTIETQRRDGSWGFYEHPTAEETAYCLQALIHCRRKAWHVPDHVLHKGARWLLEHMPQSDPTPLWIGKCLYCPKLVVRSAVLSALILLQQELGAF